MNYFVTGGTGFIGHNLIEFCCYAREKSMFSFVPVRYKNWTG